MGNPWARKDKSDAGLMPCRVRECLLDYGGGGPGRDAAAYSGSLTLPFQLPL